MTEIATSTPGRSRFSLSLPLLVVLGVYAQIFVYADRVLGDPDTYWHLAVGRWIIGHRAVPHEGIFSATMPHAPWVAHEWLAETALAGFFDRFGWTGLVAAAALCVAIALAMLLRELLRDLDPAHALIATGLAYLLALSHVLARPHIFTLPILVAWVAALVRARSAERAPPVWLALLMTLWANLHGGYIVGLGLAALLGGEAVLLANGWPARLRAARGWAVFGGFSVIAALITPFGIDGLLLPLQMSQMSVALAHLVEWRSPDFQTFQPIELWIIVVLFAAFSAGWRLPPIRALLVLLLLHMSLQHARFGEELGFCAPLLVAAALARQLAGGSVSRLDRIMATLARPARAGGVALAGALLLAISFVLYRGGAVHQAGAFTPAAALAAVGAAHVEGPVFNDYNFGGYLIFSGIEPFIDGRAELYGDAFIKRYGEAILTVGDKLPQLLAEYGVTWTLIAPGGAASVVLDHLPGWRLLYADEIAVVHVREDRPAR